MKRKEKFVLLQREFLILFTLYDNDDFHRSGIKSSNLEALLGLAGNKDLWYEVGVISEKKDFKTSLESDLSRLNLEHQYLRCVSRGSYVKGAKFDEGFRTRIAELYEYLGIIIDFGKYDTVTNSNRNALIDDIKNGKIDYIYSDYDELGEKKIHMLMDEQINKLVQLAVEFRIA